MDAKTLFTIQQAQMELTEIDEENAIKKGARNNKEDAARIQTIHDLTHEMGVPYPEKREGEIPMPETMDMEAKEGNRFSKNDFQLVKTLHDHAVNLGADCGPFVGGIAPGVDQGLKTAQRDDVNPKRGEKEYGNVDFADEANKKYPIDTAEHIRAAWNYIHKKKNAGKYSSEDVKKIKARIVAAWKEKIDKDGPPAAREKKSVSLQDLVEDVRSAWYGWWQEPEEFQGQYPDGMEQQPGWDSPYIKDVLDDAIVVKGPQGRDWKVPYTVQGVDDYQFSGPQEWQQVEESWTIVTDENTKDIQPGLKTGLMLASYGTAVKDGDNGHIGGRCVVFSNPQNADSTGDYFDRETELDAHVGMTGPIYLHHTLPLKTGDGVKRISMKIGEATITDIDDEGVEVDGILYDHLVKSHDKWTRRLMKTIKKAIKSSAMGWSTGTAAHLVMREKVGDATHIKRWPLGLDFSITPTAAGVMQSVAVEMKSIPYTEFLLDDTLDEPEVEPESAASAGDTVQPPSIDTLITELKSKGIKNMEPKDLKAIVDGVKASIVADAEAAKQAEQKEKERKETFRTELGAILGELGVSVKPSLKSGNEPVNGGGYLEGKAPSFGKTPLGDDAHKAFNWYLKTGDAGGIRTGNAYNEWQAQRGIEVKTNYPLSESIQYQGQEAVPTEVAAKIIEKRDAISVVRAAGADVINANSNAMVVPIEKSHPGAVAPTTAVEGTSFNEEQEQPMDKVNGQIYLFPLRQAIDLSLVEDATFDVEAWWGRRTSRRMAVTENQYFVLGTGTNQPQGLVTGGTAYASSSASALTFADIVNVYHTILNEYRDNVAWFMAGATEGLVRTLTGNPAYFIGNGGTQGGVGNTGFPQGAGGLVDFRSKVFNAAGMDAIGASKHPVAVGNVNAGYVILERKLLTVIRDPYTLSGQGFLQVTTYWRNSGYVTNPEAIQVLTQPSA